MVFQRHGCVAKSSTKVTTLLPVSRLALTLKSSLSLAHLFFNGLLDLLERLLEVGDQVVGVFDADRVAHQRCP